MSTPETVQNQTFIQVDNLADLGMSDVGFLLEKIVLDALNQGASDIHMEPNEINLAIRFRIDGMLQYVMMINKSLEEPLLFKIKVAARLRTDEHFSPQDGKIKFTLDQRTLDTRISILPTTKGEKVVIRLLTQEGRSFKLEDLGLTGRELETVQKAYLKPYGMILAVGPTGSGKTTTLYSILKILNAPEKNITTIEDPVEYDLPGVNHIQINVKANLTFASGLRSILRQDPNIIMVGEIRDNETAKIAVNAAMTGHLVLSTLHTNDAVTTIPRLVDIGIEPFLVASTVNLVVAQRLARLLCEHCKMEYAFTKEEYDHIAKFRNDIASEVKEGEKLFKAVGCDKCHKSGYKGRVGLYEVLDINENIRKIITEKGTADDIFKAARKDGLIMIVEDGIRKMRAGNIDLNELIRVTSLRE